jgi:hypothetical protein
MTLMHLGCSTARKSCSLIFIEDSFHQIIHLGMTHDHFLKGKTIRKRVTKAKIWGRYHKNAR